MRVLSIPQPDAQLTVRGVLRIGVRTWDPPYRGPVVIHASTAIPSKEQAAEWFADYDHARRFAEQGWMDRDDLKALPYGAIIGIAHLAEVHLGRDVHAGKVGSIAWTPELEQEIAVRNRELGMLELVKPKQPLLRVPIPDDAYAWMFVDPVEFEPITGVDGRKRLWTLRGELEGVIAERERRARKRIWKPVPVNAKKRDKALRALRERRKAERDQLLREVHERVARRRAIADLPLRRDVEQTFREELARYVRKNALSPRGSESMVGVESGFRALVDGRAVVPVEELELALRRHVKRNSDAQYATRRRLRQEEELGKIYKTATAEGFSGEKLRARLERALGRMLDEEEEDLEYVRRELHPLGAEKAERAKARREAADAAERARAEWERESQRMLFAMFTPREMRAYYASLAEEERLEGARRKHRKAWKSLLDK